MPHPFRRKGWGTELRTGTGAAIYVSLASRSPTLRYAKDGAPGATDVDGDGDTDVLSASRDDDKIAWYESDGGSPPSFTEHVISTTADYAVSVFATDLDGDGDTDVLSASHDDDKITWYENTTPPIPTVSEWGMVAMALLVVTAGTLVYRRRRPAQA